MYRVTETFDPTAAPAPCDPPARVVPCFRGMQCNGVGCKVTGTGCHHAIYSCDTLPRVSFLHSGIAFVNSTIHLRPKYTCGQYNRSHCLPLSLAMMGVVGYRAPFSQFSLARIDRMKAGLVLQAA